MWCVECARGLVEEAYFQAVELRSRIDPGQEVFQVFAFTFELKPGESGEDSVHRRRRMQAFTVKVKSRGLEKLESKGKSF